MEQKLVAVPLFLLVAASQCRNTSHLQILVILTSTLENSTYPSWSRGEELMAGAELAVRHINKCPDILQQFQVELVPHFIPNCDPIQGIDILVSNITDKDLNIIGATGMFCNKLTSVYSPLLGHSGLDLIQITGSTLANGHEGHRDRLPHLFSMLPSSRSLARAFIQVIQGFNWTRIGVVKHDDRSFISSNYIQLAEELEDLSDSDGNQSSFEVVFHHNILVGDNASICDFFRVLQSRPVNIMLMLLPPKIASLIISQAQFHGFMWPEYVWIFAGPHLEEVIECAGKELENTPFLAFSLSPALFNSSSQDNCSSLYSKCVCLDLKVTTNFYANIVYDSLWVLALALNSSLEELQESRLDLGEYSNRRQDITPIIEKNVKELDFCGATGQVEFKRSGDRLKLQVFHVINTNSSLIGWYDFRDNSIELNTSSLQPLPSDDVKVRYEAALTLPLAIILLAWIGFVYVLTSISLLLFVIHRNQPEIKASSFLLSICIYTGCYFLLFSATYRVIINGMSSKNNLRKASCNILHPFHFIGTDLIVATLLFRLLRIHYFFQNFRRVSSKKWSDSCLFLWILLIISVKVFFLVLWLCLDPRHPIDSKTFRKNPHPHYQVDQICYSKYSTLWWIITYGYSFILMLPLLVLAFKTRKIKRRDFKDTKKINTLVVCLISILVITGVLWGVFRRIGDLTTATTLFIAALSTGSVVTQVLLFLPKILPPCSRVALK